MERIVVDTETVADNIKRLRLEKEWSQDELARHSKKTTMSIRNTESGCSPPSLSTLSAIAEALEIPTSLLLQKEKSKA